MSSSPDIFARKFDRPAAYGITVPGLISDCYSDNFAGMRITTERKANQAPITILTGRVRDQAERAGVLNNLYETHVSIISVDNLARSRDE